MIYDLSFNELIEYLDSIGERKFRAKQLFEWLYKKKVNSYSEMTNLSKDFLEKIEKTYSLDNLDLEKLEVAQDGTKKFLFRLNDGNLIEAVLMQYEWGNSLCITTQVGCNIGCAFCASGLYGKNRDLSSGEIVLQVLTVEKIEDIRISNVVIMGIGEPFDNYDNTLKAVRILNDPIGLAIGARKITISTSGIVPMIDRFSEEDMQVNLAISLHASNDELRNNLMKINKKYPIEDLINACKRYVNKTNRRITFEYVLIEDVNDTDAHAHELSDLIRGINAYVNLIPYNEVNEFEFKRSSKKRMLEFYDILKKRAINVTLRFEKGIDISAACGQLRSRNL